MLVGECWVGVVECSGVEGGERGSKRGVWGVVPLVLEVDRPVVVVVEEGGDCAF